MRHPAQFGHEVGELLDLLALPDGRDSGPPGPVRPAV
jgi:hypothetical protein